MYKQPYKVIAIDDEPAALIAISSLLSVHVQFKMVASCSSVKDAEARVIEHSPDLLFIDIEMPETNGFKLIERLTKINKCPDVIFVTAHKKYMQDAFRVSPLEYLCKPIDPALLGEALDRFILKQQNLKHQALHPIHLKINGKIKKIDTNRLLCICVVDRKLKLCFIDGSATTTNQTLKDLLAQLPENFKPAHRACAVNMSYVKEFHCAEMKLTLECGALIKSINVSRGNKSTFDKEEYDLEH